jgi:hypothetical protein
MVNPAYLVITVLILVSMGTGVAASGDQNYINWSPSLSPESALNLSDKIDETLHAFEWDQERESYSAWNVGEGVKIRITGEDGVLVSHRNGSLRMRCENLGRDDEVKSVEKGRPVADGRRVDLLRNGSVEWFINHDEGIEQGMVIYTRPGGYGNLRVGYTLSGDLIPGINGDVLTFSDQSGPVLIYSGLKVTDSTGREIPSSVSLAGNMMSWDIDDSDAVYPVFVDPTITQNKILFAPDHMNEDSFGHSVALSGDIAVVGAPFADSGGTDMGQAYIFSRHHDGNNNWGRIKTIWASNKKNYAQFGGSVAISGDRVIIGAANASMSGTGRGLAYIFYKDRGGTDNWGEVKILSASDGADNDYFGESVAISGNSAIVGSGNANGTRGKAYVFSKNMHGTDNWGEVKILTASDSMPGDHYGRSVGISGETAVVGAEFAHIYQGSPGLAYVYSQYEPAGAEDWGEVKILHALDWHMGDKFGHAVAVDGDILSVGAVNDTVVGSVNTGKAYVFYRMLGGTNNWGEVKDLYIKDLTGIEDFGDSVSVSKNTIVVGAPWYIHGSSSRGFAFVFNKNHGGVDNWGRVKVLSGSDTASSDNFGSSVSVSDNIVFVGSPYSDSGGSDRGQTYVYNEQSKIAVFRNGFWIIDNNNDFLWSGLGIGNDLVAGFGGTGDTPVIGNWKESIFGDQIGVFRSGTWLLDYNGNYSWDGSDKTASLGQAGDRPVTGDWNNNDHSCIGVFRNGFWILDKNGNFAWDGTGTGNDLVAGFGTSGDVPVVRDWNGDGLPEIAVFRVSTGQWLVDNNGNYQWDGTGTSQDVVLSLGQNGDMAVEGDWNSDTTDKAGVFRNGFWILDYNGNHLWDGTPDDIVTGFGTTGDIPVPGKYMGP